jgi:Phospholipase_D-nuclease N-terminal
MARKQWSDLTPKQKRAVYVGGALETVITAAALRDLARRPTDEIRGSKVAWALAFFVQPFGPIAYLAAGRR